MAEDSDFYDYGLQRKHKRKPKPRTRPGESLNEVGSNPNEKEMDVPVEPGEEPLAPTLAEDESIASIESHGVAQGA
ncbi:MAG: hypothetical protein KDA87_26250, partial [Planctomycetales bacterium]|nr:hypothetical protein [Planctomycetales bacterium]